MRVVPRPAQGAFTRHLGLGGPVVGEDLGGVDVYAVLVGEGGVGALPGRDATAAVAEREGRFGDVQCPEPVQEVRLACYNDIVKVCVAQLADIDLSSGKGQLSNKGRSGRWVRGRWRKTGLTVSCQL